MMECEQEVAVVGGDVSHHAAHPTEALVVTQVVIGVVLGRLALGPVPAGLGEVDDQDEVVLNPRPALEGQVPPNKMVRGASMEVIAPSVALSMRVSPTSTVVLVET